MKFKNIKTYYRQNLPHVQPVGVQFFVTFRLKGSIPKAQLFKLKLEFEEQISLLKAQNNRQAKKLILEKQESFFLNYDQLLDNVKTGPHYFQDSKMANIIRDELHRFDGELYDLIAYCIMSNHVHILIDTHVQIPIEFDINSFEETQFEPLQNIMKRIKGPTAIYANRLLQREGKFWQRESFDRLIRNEKEFDNTVVYILENPVKAGLVTNWNEYPYTYYKFMN